MMKDKISILMIGVVIAIFLIGIADADTGGINLESDPSGAQIYVVSHLDVTKTPIYKGITPSLITVDAGTYDVTLNYMGYNYAISTFGDPRYDYLKNIFVSAGTANTSIPKVVLNSTSPGVELRIRTEPDGATAKIGNPPMDIGKTTISGILIANFWEGNPLTLTKEGFFTETIIGNEQWKKYKVDNSTYQVYVVLQPNNVGSATFNSVPADAKVYIDSDTSPRGKTPCTISFLSLGSHNYTLSLDGYSNVTGSFLLENLGTPPIDKIIPWVNLNPIKTVNVFFETIPAGASITVDGVLIKDVLTANFVLLSMMDHNIVFKKANYKDRNLPVSGGFLSLLPVGTTYIWPDKIPLDPLSVTVTQPENGKIEPLGGSDINYGLNKTYIVTPNPCYYVESLLVNGNVVAPGTYPGANYTFVNVIDSQTFGAKISKIKYNLTSNVLPVYWYPNTNPNANYVIPNGTSKVDCGSTLKISVVNGTGYNIDAVTVNGTLWTGSKSLVEIPSVGTDYTVNASFVIQKFNVVGVYGPGGRLFPESNKTTTIYNYGDNERFVAVADTGYSLSDMKVNGVSIVPLQPYVPLVNITRDYLLIANFTANLNTVNATSGAIGVSQDTPNVGGNITPKGMITVPYNQTQRFDITPWDCYAIQGVFVNGQNIGKVTNYTFANVINPQSIYARFVIKNYTIKTQALNAGGSITPTSITLCGTNKTIDIKPDYGFSIDKVYVDAGSPVGPFTTPWTRTFSDNNDHSVNTTFAKVPTGFVKVNSNPIGATIMIDGIDRGTTPRSVEIPVGQHTVSLTKTWYKTENIPNVAVVKGQTTDLGTKNMQIAILP